MSSNKLQINNYDIIDVKAQSLNLFTYNSLIIQNSLDTVFFGEKTLNDLINLPGADLFQLIKNRTCLCKTTGAFIYANGSIFKYNNKRYVLTTYDLGAETGIETFEILVNNSKMLRCNIAGIDRLSNLMIGLIDATSSGTEYYDDIATAQTIIDGLKYFDLGSSIQTNIFIDPINIVPGENLFMIFHNQYDSPIFSRSFMIDNYYRGNLLNAVSLEAFIFEHRPNNLEGSALVFNYKGQIVGVMSQQLNYMINSDRNIAIAISSTIIKSFIYSNIVQYYNVLASNIDTQIKNLPRLLGFLGVSYYPITPSYSGFNAIFKKLGYMGGLRIKGPNNTTNYIYQYNSSTKAISFTSSGLSTTNLPVNNPIINGGPNNDDTDLYTRSANSAEAILTSITFYSINIQKEITLTLGRYEGQFSLSRFIYDYGPDSMGLWRNITLHYIYYSNGAWQNITNQTIISKLTAYKGGSNEVNNGIIFILANTTLLNNSGNIDYGYNQNNYNLSSYTALELLARFPPTNAPYIAYNQANISNYILIVYIYADQDGTLTCQFLTSDDIIVSSQTMTKNYNKNDGYKRFEITLISTNEISKFNLFFSNGPIAQSIFKMETIISSSTSIILQQTTQTPSVLGPTENYALYQYQNIGTTINPKNYPISFTP